MKRTISAMVGKGSVNHNSRKFKAENVKGNRTYLNIDYCNDPIKQVYHELFDEALERYNRKQKRSDRKIDDYYEKIRKGKQEKLFHEIILQAGNHDDMGAETEMRVKAKEILNEYYLSFQDRNPNLRVFSAHIHMDEATPHIHIDFVPFITESKRGRDTRVSLKQALKSQGFSGGSRYETEWNMWIQSEKQELANIMERYEIEWEKKEEFDSMDKRLQNMKTAEVKLKELEKNLFLSPEYIMPEPQPFISAKNFKSKFAEPLMQKLKEIIKSLLLECFRVWDSYHRLNVYNGKLFRENRYLTKENSRLIEENGVLKEKNREYRFLRKIFGSREIDALVEKARLREFERRGKLHEKNRQEK